MDEYFFICLIQIQYEIVFRKKSLFLINTKISTTTQIIPWKPNYRITYTDIAGLTSSTVGVAAGGRNFEIQGIFSTQRQGSLNPVNMMRWFLIGKCFQRGKHVNEILSFLSILQACFIRAPLCGCLIVISLSVHPSCH